MRASTDTSGVDEVATSTADEDTTSDTGVLLAASVMGGEAMLATASSAGGGNSGEVAVSGGGVAISEGVSGIASGAFLEKILNPKAFGRVVENGRDASTFRTG